MPDGATLLGMQVSMFTAAGTVTVCNLAYGVSDSGAVIGSVTDNTSGWHWSNESTFNHVVDTSANAYAVSCSNTFTTTSFVGAVRIRYSVTAP